MSRRVSRALVAVTAAAAPVVVLAPASHAAPATPQLPKAPLGHVPAAPARTLPQAPSTLLPTVETTVTRYVTATAGANVRSGPSTSYSIVGGRAYGAQLVGTLTSNGWIKIGDQQYVSGAIISATNPLSGAAPAPSDPAPAPSTGTQVTKWVTATSGANVRSGPGTSYPVVGGRSYGTQVSGTLSNGWVRMADGTYISDATLGSTDPDAPSLVAPSTSVDRWVSVPQANVRSGPSTAYAIIGTKLSGTKVTGAPTGTGWIKLDGGAGYMADSVLSTVAPAPQAPLTDIRASLLAIAAKYVGSPYLLYGTPPDYFDCSAYTWYVYQQAGITIPRTVWQQKEAVIPVTDPLPGDLVFFDDYYHVAMYAGNGMWYEARNATVGVVYNPAWTTRVWYGRIPGL